MAELTIQQAFDLALQHQQAGRLPEAEQLYRQILAQQPKNADVLRLLGVIAHQTGRDEIAMDLFREAIAIKPGDAVVHNNLGILLARHGQLDQAAASFRQAIALNPGYADAHCNLGNALKDLRHIDEAIASLRKAIALRPDYSQAHYNLGLTLGQNGQLDEAIASFRQAIVLNPNFPEAHGVLGVALATQGQLGEAMASYRQAIALRPSFAQAHYNLGIALANNGQLDEAIASYRQAVQLNPNYLEALNNLGNVLTKTDQPDQAINVLRRAIALMPNHPAAYNNLGNALQSTGQLDDAIDAYRQAVSLKPTFGGAHSNLVYTMHLHPDYDAKAIAEELGNWNQRHAMPLKKLNERHANNRDPDRLLRIGYVSPDFRNHPAGRFLVPLFDHHDHRQFEVFCFSDVVKADEITRRIRSRADQWRPITGLGDESVAQQIREDGIDLLIDTTAHTADSRLLVFARKPAPVQLTSLFATGLNAIDFRLTDNFLDPPGQDDEFYSEQSVRLPDCIWCFEPIQPMPPVNALPALVTGHVTFGSFNNFAKINSYILGLWIEVLSRTPDSRMILQCPPGNQSDRIRKVFQAGGIAPDRLNLIPRGSIQEYFDCYHRVDICLDPTPYSGHTTTFDVLWMGVPLVTLTGRTVVGRTGVSILSNMGLTELIAKTPEEYVRLAVTLAGDLDRLSTLRKSLRERMRQSPLMDAPKFARSVESAYRQMWRNWCE